MLCAFTVMLVNELQRSFSPIYQSLYWVVLGDATIRWRLISQVIDVHIMTQPDNTNIGYIKVPTMEDAKHAISQFHRKKIGYKRIHVTTVNHDDESLANAK